MHGSQVLRHQIFLEARESAKQSDSVQQSAVNTCTSHSYTKKRVSASTKHTPSLTELYNSLSHPHHFAP